jgi:hypothetical protein
MSTVRLVFTFVTIAVALLFLSMHSTVAAEAPQGHPGAQFRIAGTIVSVAGGSPLSRARVTISDAKNPKNVQSLLTTDDGRFEFHVTAGKYALQGAKRDFIAAAYNQHEQFSTAIVTGAGLDTENITLTLAPAAVLTGKVLDESGDPIRHAVVALWREDHSAGVSRVLRFRGDTTDDQGSYEFTPLDSGTYFLSVSARPWYSVHPASFAQEGTASAPALVDRALDVVYPTTYYSGAIEAEDAMPIPVRGGDHLDLDLRLVPVSALHVVFHTEQNGQNGYRAPVLQKRVFDGIEFQNGPETQMVSPGVFEITTAPGKYTVRLAGTSQSSQITEVEISQDHQDLDTSSGDSLSSITASVHVLGEDRVPEQLFLVLRDSQGRTVAARRVSVQEQVEFTEITPGTYDLMAGSAIKAYSVVRIASQGRETPGHTLTVTPGMSLSIELSLVGGSVSVEGIAKKAGEGAAGAMVVLVPTRPEANRELFRRDQSDLDGSFTLRSVIPGTYTVIAIADGWDLDWSRPSVISSYASHGQTIVVPARSEHAIQLPNSVEVQPKE